MGNLLILSEAARQTGLSAGYLRVLVANGTVQGQRAGKFWMIDKESLDAWLAKRHQKQEQGSDSSQKPYMGGDWDEEEGTIRY